MSYIILKDGYHSQVKKIGKGDVAPVVTDLVDANGVQIGKIYAKGAGQLHIYPQQPLP